MDGPMVTRRLDPSLFFRPIVFLAMSYLYSFAARIGSVLAIGRAIATPVNCLMLSDV